MESEFYAHSREGKSRAEWQRLEEHLHGVAERARRFGSQFQSADWAWNAGWLHDLGKATNAFQSYLLRSNGLDDSEYDADGSESNHASTGAAFAEDRLRLPGRVLTYLLAGHHAGLPDWDTSETGNAALVRRLEEGRKNLATIQAFAADVQAKMLPLSKPPPFVKPENFHFWVRLLFSCLVDADRLDSEKFENGEKTALRSTFPSIGDLAPKLFQALETLEQKAKAGEVNRVRAEIRRACEAAAERPPGLFSLTVPTGGGKTLSAMVFAIRHALKHEKCRIIYVIPYTSIIEQTAKTLGDIFGPGNVVEHHSNLSPEKETVRSSLAAENWDAPIIVTTNVQLFESLYAAKPCRARKLHNIVNSVVILDEAQLLPPELLTPCVDVINQLVNWWGVTVVLATATQPALPKLEKPQEIIPQDANLYGRLKRTEIRLPGNMTERTQWTDIAARLQQHEQVLCVVNTRKDCHDLFKLMPAGTIHLSALMCGAHRSEVIAEMKRRLAANEPCRVISTQLVEAGVDIDFPVVYRALAGLDSIAQSAGRCNREGLLRDQGRLGQVHVFVPPKSAPPGLLRKGEDTMREMPHVAGFDPQKPEFFTRYFNLFYQRLNDTGSRFHDWLVRDVQAGRAEDCMKIQFRTAAANFKLIDDQAQQSVFVRYGDAAKWLAQLGKIGPTRENLRALQRYVVNLSKRDFERAKVDGLLESLWKDEYWCWAPKCDPVVGVDIFGAGWAPEDLMP